MVSSEAPFHRMPPTPPETHAVPVPISSNVSQANGYFGNHMNLSRSPSIIIPFGNPQIAPKGNPIEPHHNYQYSPPHLNAQVHPSFFPVSSGSSSGGSALLYPEALNESPYTPPTPRASLALLVEASIAAAAAEREAEQPSDVQTSTLKPHGLDTFNESNAYFDNSVSSESENNSGPEFSVGGRSAKTSSDLLKPQPRYANLERVTENKSKSLPKKKVSSDFMRGRYDFHSRSTSEIDKYISHVIQKVHSQSSQRKNEMKPIDRRSRLLPKGWTRVGEIVSNEHMRWECGRLIRGTQGCGRDCNSRFKDLTEFSSHIDLVHDNDFRPFLCPESLCPWSIVGFHERSECTRHIRTKHYQPMYTCDFPSCGRTYNRSDAFRRHVRQSHRHELAFEYRVIDNTQTSFDSAATDDDES